MPLSISHTALSGVVVIGSRRIADLRGSFARFFCDEELKEVIGARRICQINHSSTSRQGAVRGMHYQNFPHAELKMVRCLRGRVWDVAVDLRAGSPTFCRWHAEELSAENDHMLIIPEGCAHGFQALSADAELLYLHTAHYMPRCEDGVRYDDPRLAIHWPLPVTDLSTRDRSHAALDQNYTGIVLS